MKPFRSFLAPKLNEFLTYRQNLGYSLNTIRFHLLLFDRYVMDKNADWHSFQPGFFLDMRSHIKLEKNSVNANIWAIRNFFQFLIRQGHIENNPLQDIPLLKKNTIVPFIFSPEQTNRLLASVCRRIRKTKYHFLKDLAFYVVILLLARCGMRISEPLRLMRHHYRRDDRTLYIEKTKFSKDRLIPIPKEVVYEIENYLSVRKSILHDDSPFLLVRTDQKPPTDQQIRFQFHKAMKDVGLDQPKRVIGNVNFLQPSPHSLRHSFAVYTLLKIRERGGDPQHALPILAAYMGHSEYKYTSVYLRVTDAISRKNLIDFSLWQERKE
ncbi:MAG: tyrosine-type recombinase/integrase [Deltaproteobacteria bacterium]|nr:tyrosine-type recombinase/integrase [Deltaproteobacteria bacterium]